MQHSRLRPFLAGAFAALAAFLTPVSFAQEQAVEYIATPLSSTVTMIKGKGGNIAVSSGEDGVFIIDDQFKPLTDQLLASIAKVSEQPIRFRHQHALPRRPCRRERNPGQGRVRDHRA